MSQQDISDVTLYFAIFDLSILFLLDFDRAFQTLTIPALEEVIAKADKLGLRYRLAARVREAEKHIFNLKRIIRLNVSEIV